MLLVKALMTLAISIVFVLASSVAIKMKTKSARYLDPGCIP